MVELLLDVAQYHVLYSFKSWYHVVMGLIRKAMPTTKLSFEMAVKNSTLTCYSHIELTVQFTDTILQKITREPVA